MILIFTEENAIPRVLESLIARIGDDIITLTDYKAFTYINSNLESETPDKKLIEKLIEKRLLLKSASIRHVSAEEIDKKEQELIATLKNSDKYFVNKKGRKDFDNYIETLEQADIDREIIREELKRTILVNELIDKQIRPFVFVTQYDIDEYYKAHEKDQGFDLSIDNIRKQLENEKMQKRIDRLLKKLRSRQKIEIIEFGELK